MLRTDLALEAQSLSEKEGRSVEGVKVRKKQDAFVMLTVMDIINEDGEKALGKAMGRYVTIEAPGISYDHNVFQRTCEAIAETIDSMADINENTLTLVTGLGNEEITPDALGVRTAGEILVTHHLKQHMPGGLSNSLSCVCALAPGVMGNTGMETVEIIKSVCNDLKPDLVIAVDALAAAQRERLGMTVQISDTGIQPGAGVGNNRKGINYDTLNTKVIAVGIPTVIDASAFSGNEADNDPLMVTPKDIDKIIDCGSKAIGMGINMALHKKLSADEIESLAG